MKGCRALTDLEANQVLEAFSGSNATRDRTLFTVGLFLGFRISENLSLRVADVLQNGRVVDSITVARKFMKGKDQSRTVALHATAKQALVERLKELEGKRQLKPETYIYRSQRGGNKPISRTGAWMVYKKVFNSLGLTGKLGTHASRKTFCKRVHEKLQFDLIKTQRAMGHKNIQSTISYLSFNESEITDAILSI